MRLSSRSFLLPNTFLTTDVIMMSRYFPGEYEFLRAIGSTTLNYVNEGQMTKIQGRIGEDHCDRHLTNRHEQELCEHCALGGNIA